MLLSIDENSSQFLMPRKGRPSFLQNRTIPFCPLHRLCQCPERGDLHFYGNCMFMKRSKSMMCQCPERGDLHFYADCVRLVGENRRMCQCPERGDLHFYGGITMKIKVNAIGVNALKGATFISTPRLWEPA